MEVLFLILLVSGAGALLTASIASRRGRSWFLWFIYALLLLPIAFIHALTLSPNDQAFANAGMVQCPHCMEWIRPGATICSHCRSQFEQPLEAPRWRFTIWDFLKCAAVAIGAVWLLMKLTS